MEIKILQEDKQELKVQVNNLTITEILRVYLNEDDSVSLAVWKREHPSKAPILQIRTKGRTAKKALQDAIARIEKDTDKFLSEFKKVK